jgi:microsomal dipeptidase-like Zn-dependent dipeptidase
MTTFSTEGLDMVQLKWVSESKVAHSATAEM